MSIAFQCPQCGHGCTVPDEHAGKRGSCARCKAPLVVPAATPDVQPGPTVTRSVPPLEPPTSHKPRRGFPLAAVGVVVLLVVAALGLPFAARWRESRRPLARGGLRQLPASKPSAPTSPPVAGAEWPGFRGALRDGKSPDRGLLKAWPAGGPPLAWQASGIGSGFSSPAIAGGKVYVTGLRGNTLFLSALDLNGKSLWTADVGPDCGNVPGARSTPTLDGGSLYIVSGAGLIGCYDAGTGSRRWTRDMSEFGGRAHQWGYSESVLIYQGLAIVTPGGSQCMVALDKKSGQTVWRSRGFSAPAHYSSPIAVTFEGVPMIINGTGGGILAVSPKDGTVLWSDSAYTGNTANCPSPAYADGHVFWANGYGKGGVCFRLHAPGGRVIAQEVWSTREMDCHHGGYVIVDGFIYGNHGGGWNCLDLRTGQTRWGDRGVGKGSLCYADGMLYLFSENGGRMGLATCSPAGLEMKGEFTVAGRGQSWAHPVVIGGRLYVRYDDNLYCYDLRQ